MAILTTRSTDPNPSANLVDENGAPLTDALPAPTTPVEAPTFPIFLALRLRLKKN